MKEQVNPRDTHTVKKLLLFQHLCSQTPLNPILWFFPSLFYLSFLWKLHGDVFHEIKCR